MSGRGSRLDAARLLCAAAAACARARACARRKPLRRRRRHRRPTPAELDPSAPLDPMPDLGVAWPELNAKDTAAPAAAAPAPPQASAEQPRTPTAAATSATPSQVEGLAPSAMPKICSTHFRQQSALEAERKDPANAAQIGRRASADADLLEPIAAQPGLLRRRRRAADRARPATAAGRPDRRSGPAISLCIGRAARAWTRPGPDAAKLRDAFAVKAGDPVIAAT